MVQSVLQNKHQFNEIIYVLRYWARRRSNLGFLFKFGMLGFKSLVLSLMWNRLQETFQLQERSKRICLDLKFYRKFQLEYTQFNHLIENIIRISQKNLKIQLVKISECFNQQDYQQVKDNLQVIKEWYQYFNNQEEIMKQNQSGTSLVRIKRMIKALDFQEGQQIQHFKQDNEDELQQAIQLINEQKWQEADEKITKYIKLSEKQYSLATLFKSICLIEMNQPGQGMIMREQAKKINHNLYNDLLEFSNQGLVKTPYNFFMLITKSYALNEEKKFQEVIEVCEQVLREEPKYLHALYRKSYSLYVLTQYSQTISCIDIALKYNPQYSIGYFIKGTALYNLNNYNDAIACYEKAIQLDSNFAMAYNNKGSALDSLGNYSDAIVFYDKAIQLNPNFAMTYNNKGNVLDSLKKYDDAIDCYDKAIQLNPNNPMVFNSKGSVLQNLNKFNDAIVCYDKAIQINPYYALAYNNKGNALQNLNNFQDAIECYDKAIQLDPNFIMVYNNKGIALQKLNNNYDAIYCYDKAIQIDPNFAKAYISKGDLLKNMKNYSKAIENYEQAIKYCKSNEDEFKRLMMELKNEQLHISLIIKT